MFQSPSGVLGVCGAKRRCGLNGRHFGVSVPFRGFRGLRVVLLRAGVLLPLGVFQSPSGVLGVCGHDDMWAYRVVTAVFQSPSGVLGVCGHGDLLQRRNPDGRVSVPFRGFRGLRDIQGCGGGGKQALVSVPFRGFRGLRGASQPPGRRERHRVSVPFRGFRGLRAIRR